MKYNSKQIENAMVHAEDKYGSVLNAPSDIWKPFRQDFLRDDQNITHYFVDEKTYPWNTPLKTRSIKVYNIAKLVRSSKVHSIDDMKKVLKKIHLTPITYDNIIYQLHMSHRGYSYTCPNYPPLYCSFRDEIVSGIIQTKMPGPRTQALLTTIIHHNGIYKPKPNSPIQGIIGKFFVYRGVKYYPNLMHYQDNRPTLVLPYLRIPYHDRTDMNQASPNIMPGKNKSSKLKSKDLL